MKKDNKVRSQPDKMNAAADFIETYYSQPITISCIAYEVKLSPGRLSHLFKERMGVTPIEYLTNIRIEKAKKLLLTTDKKCCNLYYDLGYNSQSYFARKFKEVVGISPAQFRACKGKFKNLER